MRIALLLIISSILCCGCRVNPNAEREIALLRAEILDLEDQYYALKSQRDTAVTQLRDCQGVDFDGSRFPDPQLPGDCVNCDDGAIIYDSSVVYEDGATVIEQGVPFDLNTSDQIQSYEYEQGSPVIESTPGLEEVPAVEGNTPTDDGTSILDRQRGLTQGSIRTIRIHPQVSKGEDLDGTPGHEGLSLLVQPVNAQSQVVNEVGQMTIQVLERDRLASSRQIGIWRFTPEETRSFQVREGVPDQGILLHLPWSQILPTRNAVTVVVNFVVAGNQRHTARLQIPIQPPRNRYSLDQPIIANWIENDERWRETAGEAVNQEIDFGTDFDQPEFQSTSGGRDATTEPDSDRRTSVPRWRPVR